MVFHGISKLSIDEQEVLEQVLQAVGKDGGVTSVDIASKMKIPHLGDTLKSLEAKKLITRSHKSIFLTRSGNEEAAAITRRNRLAQVLFTQVFDMPYNKAADIACKFEHLALSDDVTNSICTFLGHPPQSPDGKPIPSGRCCREGRMDLVPIVKRLTELKIGESGTVVFVAPGSHSVLDRLSSFGIIPGEEIRIHQKNPSLVIQFSFTTMALEEEVAQNIFVRLKAVAD
jgi:DtxR family Mn-dependent transcriptional regulator